MIRFFLVISYAIFSTWAPALGESSCTHDARAFRCVKFLKNYDGDTITFQIPGVHPLLGENISVRVRGIDTPEIKGKAPCEKDRARDARRLVESMLRKGKQVNLENVERDKYFRILADVVVDGKSVGPVLLKNHLAYSYDGGTKEHLNWCSVRVPASVLGN